MQSMGDPRTEEEPGFPPARQADHFFNDSLSLCGDIDSLLQLLLDILSTPFMDSIC